MEKSSNSVSNYNTSKFETQLINTVRDNLIVFTPSELKHLIGWDRTKINNIVQQLKNKGIVLRLKRNHYIINEDIEENIFRIATELFNPSYISFWTALSYYGFTEQQPKSIQVVTPKRYSPIKIKSHTIIPARMKPSRFFGYVRRDNFNLAEKEKAIIDSLAYPEKAGGLREVVKAIRRAKINKGKLIAYLRKYDNISLNARISYILNLKGLRLPNTYVKLDKNKPKSKKRNKKYMLMINNDI